MGKAEGGVPTGEINETDKSEYRNPKFETIFNDQNLNDRNGMFAR
jgi:hypothetical protein